MRNFYSRSSKRKTSFSYYLLIMQFLLRFKIKLREILLIIILNLNICEFYEIFSKSKIFYRVSASITANGPFTALIKYFIKSPFVIGTLTLSKFHF